MASVIEVGIVFKNDSDGPFKGPLDKLGYKHKQH